VPYFDSEIPGEGESGEFFLTVVLGLVVGASVVLVAGHWRAWLLALAATLAGALQRRSTTRSHSNPLPQTA
jgi:hypothetical protein